MIQKIKERDDAQLLGTMILRSMSQAVYSEENKGHFGLAYPAYTHFTSPIRRYPDLLVHRAIKFSIQKKNKKKFYYSTEKMHEMGIHCSKTERRADEATRDVVSWLKCEFMQDKVGQTFRGKINSVLHFGLFVELCDFYVEGLVHITALRNDYYHFDSARHQLKGDRTGKVYQIGDRLDVFVARVDLEKQHIDFTLPEDKNFVPPPPKSKKKKRRRR